MSDKVPPESLFWDHRFDLHVQVGKRPSEELTSFAVVEDALSAIAESRTADLLEPSDKPDADVVFTIHAMLVSPDDRNCVYSHCEFHGRRTDAMSRLRVIRRTALKVVKD